MIRVLFKDEKKGFGQMLLAIRAIKAARTPIVTLFHVLTLNFANNVVAQTEIIFQIQRASILKNLLVGQKSDATVST